jgi:imidazole glycerol-phosphate synthase subunit HisH
MDADHTFENQPIVGVLDYGMGNIGSVLNAINEVGGRGEVVSKSSDIKRYRKLIIPGVGAFREAMDSLHSKGFVDVLNKYVADKNNFLLGICLGMQMLCKDSLEGGDCKGLGLFDANVIPFSPKQGLKIPHMGWNSLDIHKEYGIMEGVESGSDVYFVHSFIVRNNDPDDVIATADYGGSFTSIMGHENIFAMQFHPEKSQAIGLKMLSNFIKLR